MFPLKNYIKRPSLFFLGLLNRTWWLFPDKLFLQLKYRLEMGKKLDLKNPKTFSEKLQWLKLYNRRPEYTTMVDKYAVKEYVAGMIGVEYIIPTLGVWDKPEQIDWDKLPDQFVLKTTHGGGGTGVVVCKDKNSFDKKKAISRLNQSLKSDIYHTLREWPYKNVRKRIIAEKYMEDSKTKDMKDYKFFCFDGFPKFCQVIGERNTKMVVDFFDTNWIHQPFHEPQNIGFANVEPSKPKKFDDMLMFAKQLSAKQPFLRVDFYEVNDDVYFGEITFFPTSGMGGFNPDLWDYTFGKMINLKDL